MLKQKNLIYPYSKPSINKNDINNVLKVLQDGYLTQGKRLIDFEEKVKRAFNVKVYISL